MGAGMLNLLDGLRDLKAPLASGIVILFALWLAFANGIAGVEPGDSLAGNVRRLTEYLGVPATLGIIAFVSYLLGLVLSPHRIVLRLTSRLFDGPGTRSRHMFSRPRRLALPPDTQYRFGRYAVDVTREAEKRGVEEWDIYSAMNPDGVGRTVGITGWKDKVWARVKAKGKSADENDNYRMISDTINTAERALANDVNLLAAQLQTAKEKTYEQYDKAKTEADFRAGLVLPLLLVASVAGYRLVLEGLPWVGGSLLVGTIFLVAGLTWTARTRLLEANQILVTALILGNIELPALAAVKKLGPAKKHGPWPFMRR